MRCSCCGFDGIDGIGVNKWNNHLINANGRQLLHQVHAGIKEQLFTDQADCGTMWPTWNVIWNCINIGTEKYNYSYYLGILLE